MRSLLQPGEIFRKRLWTVWMGIVVCFVNVASANPEKTLHAFNGADGSSPYAPLIADKGGNLYGTTTGGGSVGLGTVFRIAPDGTQTVLYSFSGGTDGANPFAGLLLDRDGNLYGTTSFGGAFSEGVIFKLAPDNTESVLYTFTGGSDGGNPFADLTKDRQGNLYGTTNDNGAYGFGGVVFKLGSEGTYTVLHSFAAGRQDGLGPYAGVTRDAQGNLYGTTPYGGASNEGTLYELTGEGAFSILNSFGGSEGAYPLYGRLIRDATGNLYGCAPNGGAGNGTVYKVALDRTATVLYSFTGGIDGRNPNAGLDMDAAGNLYGVAHAGGAQDFGIVFRLAPDGSYTVLHSFTGGSDGGYPYSRPLVGPNGTLYGTTSGGTGPQDYGTVYKIKN